MQSNILKNEIREGWKEKAASIKKATVLPPGAEVEKAFMDQAYIFVENKAGPLMNPEYRVGFEVVHKDDDNTRMVGIFAFKVGKELLFIPVFFNQGKIKGTDLLYRSSTKMLCPLTADWVKAILGETKTTQGTLVSEDATRIPNSFSLEKIKNPPMGTKRAFAEMVEKLRFEDESKDSLKLASFLKQAGKVATEYVGEMIKRSDEFAEAMHIGYDSINDWLPDSYQATQPANVTFSIKLAASADMSKEEKDEFFSRGFCIRDKRAAEDQTDEVEMVQNFMETSETGKYSVLGTDMKMHPMLILREMELNEGQDLRTYGGSTDVFFYDIKNKGFRNEYAFHKDNGVIVEDAVDGEEDAIALNSVSISNLSTDSAYLVVAKDLSKGFVFKPTDKISSSERGAVYKGITDPSFLSSNYSSKTVTFTNDKKDQALGAEGIVSTDSFYILPLDTKKEGENLYPASMSFDPMRNRQFSSFLKYGSQDKGVMDISLQDGEYLIRGDDYHTSYRNPALVAAFVVKQAGLSKELVYEVLDQAKQKPVKFFYEKKARSLYFPDFENETDESFDPYFNIAMENPQIDAIEAEGTYEEPKTLDELLQSEIGIQDGGLLNGVSPLELAQLADTTGVSSIFDHGVIGSLVNTFDSGLLIDSYLPDLEKALDKLGRLVFLFYWKPDDFTEMYGSNDQSSIENILLSNFKSFGEITLELKKKNKAFTSGNASLV